MHWGPWVLHRRQSTVSSSQQGSSSSPTSRSARASFPRISSSFSVSPLTQPHANLSSHDDTAFAMELPSARSVHHRFTGQLATSLQTATTIVAYWVLCDALFSQRVVRSSHRNWREAEAEAFEHREKVDARYLQLQNVLFEKVCARRDTEFPTCPPRVANAMHPSLALHLTALVWFLMRLTSMPHGSRACLRSLPLRSLFPRRVPPTHTPPPPPPPPDPRFAPSDVRRNTRQTLTLCAECPMQMHVQKEIERCEQFR
jgi:hypothetical protein